MKHDDRQIGLDPSRDPHGWERAVKRIVAAAEWELARRRREAGLLLDEWARPLLAVAASLILLACGTLLWDGPVVQGGAGTMEASMALEDVFLPPGVAEWLRGDEPLTVEELVFTGEVAE